MNIESMIVILNIFLGLYPQGVGFYGHRKNLDPKNQKSRKSLARENRDNCEFGANFSGGYKIRSLGLRDLIFFEMPIMDYTFMPYGF